MCARDKVNLFVLSYLCPVSQNHYGFDILHFSTLIYSDLVHFQLYLF